MDDLIAFLRARLNVEESAAFTVESFGFSSPWATGTRLWIEGEKKYLHSVVTWTQHGADHRVLVRGDNGTVAEYIARHDPAREQEEIAAKRRIIDWCEEIIGDRDLTRYGQFGALKDDQDALAVTLAVENLRSLGLPYAAHPNYREEWKP